MEFQLDLHGMTHKEAVNKCENFLLEISVTPYFDATVRWGAKDFSVYNHMYIPRDFGDPEQNFHNLINEAILLSLIHISEPTRPY